MPSLHVQLQVKPGQAQADLEAHRQTPRFQHWLQAAGGMLAGPRAFKEYNLAFPDRLPGR